MFNLHYFIIFWFILQNLWVAGLVRGYGEKRGVWNKSKEKP